jgi:hypothetical protein
MFKSFPIARLLQDSWKMGKMKNSSSQRDKFFLLNPLNSTINYSKRAAALSDL